MEVFDLESNGDPLEVLPFLCLYIYVFVRLKEQITLEVILIFMVEDFLFVLFPFSPHPLLYYCFYSINYVIYFKVLFHIYYAC